MLLSKRTKKMLKYSAQDRVSDLPDSVLIYILSFLDMKDVVRTSVLAKRWQYIWTSVSTLTFVCTEDNGYDMVKFVRWVDTVLPRFQHTNIEKFRIQSPIFGFDSEIDSWAQFAVDKKVGDLSLNFNDSEGDIYYVPLSVQRNSSLTNLSLCRCVFPDRGFISWPSLKSLSLESMDLYENTIQDILCGCPMLEFLKIIACWGFDSLHIESKTLKELVITPEEEYSEAPTLKVLAPNLESLKLDYGDFSCLEVQLVDVSSLLRATLNFSHPDYDDDDTNFSHPDDDDDTFKGLFKSFCHVKELDLGVHFIRCISEDLFRSDRRVLYSTLSCLTCLKLSLGNGKIDGPGIIALLKCSPNLETLLVYSSHNKTTCSDSAKQAEEFWKLNRRIKNFPLPHLKTVKFFGFTDMERDDKYILKLVWFLLKNAGYLGSITIGGGEYDMIYQLRTE